MIVINATYEIVSHESAEHGEYADSGFILENETYTVRELLQLIKHDGYGHKSCSHGIPRWISTEPEQDFCTGEYETRSIHPVWSKKNIRRWEKILKLAKLI